MSVALELSGNEVVLTPSPGLLADSGKKLHVCVNDKMIHEMNHILNCGQFNI